MVGTDIQSKGGIAAVVRGYHACGLFDDLLVSYVASHCDGGPVAKFSIAIGAWGRVFWAMLRMPSPLVHIHIASRLSFWRKYIVCLIARAFRRPYILHVHGGEFISFFSEECPPAAQRLIRGAFNKAAAVLALSGQWKTDLLQIFPDATVEVLPNAVALPDLTSSDKHRLDRCTEKILFLGRLGRKKGTYDLVNAFARIAPLFPRSRLICAGDGDSEPFRRLAVDLNISDRVDFPGWVGPDRSRDYFQTSAIFALPSHAEGVPIALLEAMSWRLAVISSPVGGIPEVVQDNQNGLLVIPRDVDGLAQALSKLLSDSTFRIQIGLAARATVEQRYSMQANIVRLGEIYTACGFQLKSSS